MKYLWLLLLLPTMGWSLTPAQQFERSVEVVMQNSTMPDVYPGMVVASPSRVNPNYYFDWVRDTALTYRAIIDLYELRKDPKVKEMIKVWVAGEARRQNLPSLTGLGEPKYTIDGNGYNGPWGRPQNDGPALRAIASIKFANLLLRENETQYVLENLYTGVIPAESMIKKDLEYTAHNWREHSFEPWEEEKGMHFYVLLAQHTALQEGAKLARELGDGGAADFYAKISLEIADYLKANFLDDQIGIRVSSVRSATLGYKNSLIDVSPLLALLHTSPYQKLFSFRDPHVVKYINTLVSVNKQIYKINHDHPNLGVAIGRYPEDKYTGYHSEGEGNPWFLTTIGLGEYYCQTGGHGSAKKQFDRAFFHMGENGSMSEQINRNNGYMMGAEQLTWSHNSYMTAMMRCGYIK
jgi:glucoamylase